MNAKLVMMVFGCLCIQVLYGADRVSVVQQQPTAQMIPEKIACDLECAKRCAVGASLPVSIPLACIYGFFCGAFRGCLRSSTVNAEESCGKGEFETCEAKGCFCCMCCPYYFCAGLCSGAAEGARTMPLKLCSYACGLKTDTRWQECCVERLGAKRSTREKRDSRDCCKFCFCEDSN